MTGWNLPPGCTVRMVEEAYGCEQPCEVCGLWPEMCICPECPVCAFVGDPHCYREHGLQRNQVQIAGAIRLRWEQVVEDAYWEQYAAAINEERCYASLQALDTMQRNGWLP
jgi:hypothetical protein